jgi:hypothetical protein
VKNKMIHFDNVSVKDYAKIKRGLKKSFKTVPCLSDNRLVIETFDVLLTNSKLPITYFKSKKLEISNDSSNVSKKIIETIQNILNVS